MSSHSQFATDEPDFELQMQSLAEEAQQVLGERTGGKRQQPGFLEFFRPLVQHMETLSRAMTENTMAIARLEETAGAHAARLEEAVGTQSALPRMISSIHDTLDQKNKLNQRLFDALHSELKDYKDAFLLEVFHRPIACDLITLFDDLSELHRQTKALAEEQQKHLHAAECCGGEACAQSLDHVHSLGTRLDHAVHSVLEVLARMEVRKVAPCVGRLDKHKQRVVSVERAQTSEEDMQVTASLKPGFLWRERMLRPEEVIMKKWRSPDAPAPQHTGHGPAHGSFSASQK